MSTISLELDSKQINKLKTTFKSEINDKTPAYALFQIRTEGCVITAYQSLKVVFQGPDAPIYASSFGYEEKPETNTTVNNNCTMAGSDEVGTGDYFGPVCVCACIVDKTQITKLKELGVQDSKALTDKKIEEIAPSIMKMVKYSLLIVEPTKYNQIHDANNMNAIKAKLHNQAYVNLAKKYRLPSLVVIDQFTPEKSYYRYLKGEKQIIKHIHFETKAENKFVAVACGSIIARYAFLNKWREMEEKWDMKLVKGAGDKTNESLIAFVKRYGEDKLNEVAKVHFKNTEIIKQ